MTALMARRVDAALVGRMARAVGEALASAEVDREAGGRSRLPASDAHQLTLRLVSGELDRLAADRLASGRDLLGVAEEEALHAAVLAHVEGLGRLQPYLEDPEISDIHIRGCDSVWLKLRDGRRVPGEAIADTDDELIDLVRMAATRLGRSERRFDAAHPELNLQLPDGSRLFATMEVSSRPSVIIRRHRFELSSLDELAALGMVDEPLHAFFAAAVAARRNLIVAGGTGSGKTTLLRALLNEVPWDERIVTIEDAYELGLDRFADRHPDHDLLQTRSANIEGRGEVTMLDLSRMALRMDPDRVVVGEVRGAEALPSHLTLLVINSAIEMANRCLDLGDVDGCFWATSQGIRVLPAHEELVCLRMRAHARRGHLVGVRLEYESYERAITSDPWGHGEPSPKVVAERNDLLRPVEALSRGLAAS
jgi:Flp pilus assembly CpaF family ATPase